MLSLTQIFCEIDMLVSFLCSAGGMALSTLVPSTVSSVSQLARSSVAALQVWSLHGLLSTIEAAGLSYISHVQVIGFQPKKVALQEKVFP